MEKRQCLGAIRIPARLSRQGIVAIRGETGTGEQATPQPVEESEIKPIEPTAKNRIRQAMKGRREGEGKSTD